VKPFKLPSRLPSLEVSGIFLKIKHFILFLFLKLSKFTYNESFKSIHRENKIIKYQREFRRSSLERKIKFSSYSRIKVSIISSERERTVNNIDCALHGTSPNKSYAFVGYINRELGLNALTAQDLLGIGLG